MFNKKHSHKLTAQDLADNLNRNVILDHLERVEKGQKEPDDIYRKYAPYRNKLQTLSDFRDLKRKLNPKPYDMKRELLIIILTAIVYGAGWFYWSQWRPAEIRKECTVTANQKAYDEQNDSYRSCLSERGLKPEDLYN